MLNKSLANQIQQNNEKILHYVQMGLISGMEDCLTFENPTDVFTILKFKEQHHTIITIIEWKAFNKI